MGKKAKELAFLAAIADDLFKANREINAANKLEEALANYEKVMGVKLKLEIIKDETCS